MIDDNYPALGSPVNLLDETKATQVDLESDLDEVAAHNAARDAVGFESRYREYVGTDDWAQTTLEAIANRAHSGETVALICYQGEAKRCHSHVLSNLVRERVDLR